MNRTLVFNEKELNIVLFALQKLPYETVNELIPAIVKQLQAQQDQVEVKPEGVVLTKQ